MICVGAAGWLLGLLISFLWPNQLLWWGLAAIVAILLAGLRSMQKLRWGGGGLLAGLGWGLFWVAYQAPLPQAEQGGLWSAEVVFTQPVSRRQDHWVAEVRLLRLQKLGETDWQAVNAKVRLSAWKEMAQHWQPRAGTRWRVRVRLKPIHGWVNFYGFDYERWAFARGLQARASVVSSQTPERVGQQWTLGVVRQAFAEQIATLWRDSPFAGIYDALSYGERGAMTQAQWQLFRQTGTVHLMAISGLHMGLAAALSYGLLFWLWRFLPPVQRLVARPHFAVWGMWLVVSGYGVLSGWAVSAQRAWIMVVLVGLLVLWRRNWHPWALLALAAWLVTLIHPPSVLSVGFWLSFTAVALIFTQIFAAPFTAWPRWRQLVWLQLVLMVGLMPLSLLFLHHHAGLNAWVNLLLVPLLPLLLVLLVLSAVTALLWREGAQRLVQFQDGIWQAIMQLLERVASWDGGLSIAVPVMAASAASVLIVWLLWRWPIKGLGAAVLVVIALVSWPNSLRPPPGQVWVTVLDVGQGQAIVVETANRVLVYDVGPRWGPVDGGETVLAHLRGHGWRRVDVAILSHDDRDHTGGWPTLHQGIGVHRVYAGQPERMAAWPCDARWQWDGVMFELMQPAGHWRKDNDRSCVLRIQVGQTAMIVSGDLSRRAERALIEQGRPVSAALMVAGHHGSATSNGDAWLDAVAPQQVAVSAGYRNPFRQPAATVKARWLRRKLPVHCTGCDGALWYVLDAQGVRLHARARTLRHTAYRHRCEGHLP
ncbi:MAG TPA: DNA internalization-related competence protein ComEC/Rec2 [Piscirickettsiaceae bacterium]|nr:DNA internalization-related competence protein ComEC/Rec2 [Piscirickettsiaceae bacterium]